MLNLPSLLLLLGALAAPLTASAFSFPWTKTAPQDATKAQSHQTQSHRAGEPRLADRILVKKAERRLYLMRGNEPIRSYKIALGYQPTGHKQRQGDGRTPEGRYYIDRRSDGSNYRKALHISYPREEDRLRALRQGNDPGGLIMIHGQPNNRRERRTGDWTFGCIAVSDMEIDEIWELTTKGTPVEILP
jgi:murein L,D-transpeptidase YafK